MTDLQTSQYALSLILSFYEQKWQQLPPSKMPSFQDPEIQKISHSYFCNSVPDTENHNVERPLKKARLAAVGGDHVTNIVRSNAMNRVYSLIGLQVDNALTGLSKNAVWVAECLSAFPGANVT